MKNIKGILAGVLALAALMVSCVAEQDTTPEVDITTVRCTIPRIDVEEDFATGILDTLTATKATFSNGNFLWSAGDKIGIVPNTGAQIYFEVDNGAGTSTASFDGGDWAMKSTGTFYAYYPLYPDIFLSKDHVSVSYTGQTQSGNNNNLHTGDYWTLYTEGTTAVGNALNFSFNHLTSFFKTYVTVPAGTYTKITFSAPTDVFIKDGYFDLSAQTPTIVGTTMTDELSLNLQNVTFADETELTGYLVLAPVDITGVPITVTVYKDGEPAYEYTLTKANPMVAAKTYAFRATALTQLAASATQANALFAAGATSVSITEPLTKDMAIVLPNTSEAVTLTLPTTASSSTLTVSYPQNAASYPATLSITGPEGADLDIQTPNSTVTINGVAYDQVTSRTAANTCIIPVGVTVNNLKVVQGGVQVYGTVTQIDLSEQEDDAIVSVSGSVAYLLGEDDEEYVPATGVTLNQSSINLKVGATETLTATVAPVGAYPKVIWTSSDETVATVSASGVVSAVAAGSATITATTICDGFSAACAVTIPYEPEYVDLGLSVLWGTCNLGASTPEGEGNDYAWGETIPKENYDWSTYLLSNGDNFSNITFTKYCLSLASNYWDGAGLGDDKRFLESEDDAASVNLGDKWRIPTDAEWKELINPDNCQLWMTANYNGTGVGGMIITSKKNGYTNNSIFLPADNHAEWYWASCLSNTPYLPCLTVIQKNGSGWGVGGSGGAYRYSGLKIRPVYGEFVHVTGLSLSESVANVSYGDSFQLIATVTPANASSPTLYWSSSDISIATVNSNGLITPVSSGTATITATTYDCGYTASCEVTVLAPSHPVPEAVDLGLSVKWASCNLGASTPEEYGNYYAWGETHAKDLNNFWWGYYKWCNGSSNSLTKYNTNSSYGVVDNMTVLVADDDAARVKLGSGWRLPTEAEWEELMTACTWEWTTRNGVNGFNVTSNQSGYLDKWIFLPVPGYRNEANNIYNYGLSGHYWSSSLYIDEPNKACQAYLSSSSGKYCYGQHRSDGLSIRPVTE